MKASGLALALAVVAVVAGFVGSVLDGVPIFAIGAFFALIVAIGIYAFQGSGDDRTAEDLRRADRPEEHRWHEGPGPFGPS